MKKTALFLALIICILLCVTVFCACDDWDTAQYDAGQIKIMSVNVRRVTSADTGLRAWKNRRSIVIENIKEASPTIIGMQEVTPLQYKYLQRRLNNYNYTVTYRDNTAQSEACPIFYRKDLYTLVQQGTFWLSETPDVVSKDWGAAYYRICTFVVLRDNATQKQFAVFNTHLDNESETARVNGFGVIQDKINALKHYPTVVMGDFNDTENSEIYTKATENFFDVKYQVDNAFVNCATFHNWGQEVGRTIDYILIAQTGFTVNSYQVITTTYNGKYASDHFPIVSLLTLT